MHLASAPGTKEGRTLCGPGFREAPLSVPPDCRGDWHVISSVPGKSPDVRYKECLMKLSNSQGAGWWPVDTADFDHGPGLERKLYGDVQFENLRS